jgi:hypothetical protein
VAKHNAKPRGGESPDIIPRVATQETDKLVPMPPDIPMKCEDSDRDTPDLLARMT